MTDYFGTIGTQTKNTTPAKFSNIKRGRINATVKTYWRDEATADVAQNDRIYAGCIPSNARLARKMSYVKTTDFGTSITLDLGIDDTDPNLSSYVSGSSTKLMSSVDIATAATETDALVNISAGNGNKRAWEMLGLTADPKCDIDLWFTLAGGNPASGTIEWVLAGS